MTEQTSQAPERIDHYRIERVLYEGNGCVVYRAFDERENRAAAIKITASGELPSSPSHRVWREGQLEHPSILKCHGSGTHEGRPYIAIEYADGGMFDTFLAQVRRSIPENVRAKERLKDEYIVSMIQRFYDLALALVSIHRGGSSHGNIKPSNIAICTNRNQFKLSDIGASTSSSRDTELELHQIAYRAPETLRNKAENAGEAAADVYALGVVLYEALTLEYPHDAEDAKQYITRVISSRAVPAASRNPNLPANVESVVMKAVAQDPSDRYQSASEFADDLLRIMNKETVTAPSVSPGDRILVGLKRHWLATLFVLVLVAIVGLIIFRDFLY